MIRQRILDILDANRIMTVATLRPDGWPQATTVGYVNDGLAFWFLCGRDSQKAANLARDDRVSLTINGDPSDIMAITGLSMAARAIPVTQRAEAAKVIGLMPSKYPEQKALPVAMPTPGQVSLFRIEPTVVSVLDYTKGFGHADLVTGRDDCASKPATVRLEPHPRATPPPQPQAGHAMNLKVAVEEFTTPDPVMVPDTASIDEMVELMERHDVRHLPIVRDGEVVGVVSDRDLRLARGLSEDRRNQVTARDVMAADPISVLSDTPLDEVAFDMSERKIGSVLVYEESGDYLGIFTVTDALNALIEIVRGET